MTTGKYRKIRIERGSVAGTGVSPPISTLSSDGVLAWADGVMALEGSLDYDPEKVPAHAADPSNATWGKLSAVGFGAYDTVANGVVAFPTVPAWVRFQNGGAQPIAFQLEGFRQL